MNDLVNQPTLAPTRKVAVQAATALVVYVLIQVFGLAYDPALEAGVAWAVGGLMAYFVRDRANTP